MTFTPAALGVKRAAVPQWRALTAALAGLPAVPCHRGDAWTADLPSVRAKAARACHGCPAIAECAAFATANGERFGV